MEPALTETFLENALLFGRTLRQTPTGGARTMYVDHSDLNLLWLLGCTAAVFLLPAGFCCLESGLVRAKNSINVAIKNLIDICVSAGIFWFIGFGFMFGASSDGLFGTSEFCFESASVSDSTFFLFQVAFCGTAATIVSGAVAERMRFTGYVLVTLVV